MSASNRAARITKLHSALKKHYKPLPPQSRPLMEHLLYACLLEGAPAELADEGLAKLEQQYFDWNEVRVTTIAEIAEVLASLPAPMMAATRLKRCLQSAFETFYSFDLEELKKQNLGKAVEQFESLSGMTPFVSSYIAQHGLGGHSIPVDAGGLRIMYACGIINEAELATRKVPGLERAISKNKGAEFGSLLQQASVALRRSTKDKSVHAVVLAVDKEGLDRLINGPDTDSKSGSDAEPVVEVKDKAATSSEKTATKKAAARKGSVKKATATKASSEEPKTVKKAPAKKAPAKKAPAKKATAKKDAAKSKPAPAKKAVKKSTAKSAKASSKKLTKRKPR